ncbi:hypothetical protein M378DRAFT_956574 [Amanita muscaria Koide BX008]|uniref:Uncharacterized protein n=1 Tax=Amanita muscaria (strain Koide BX008) TaxID=946122 RepID=A0A0C2WUM2_AMAMK|nr:hypothetical protein M378DRAFT_956574 [Amanita muscaria Koide BX008]
MASSRVTLHPLVPGAFQHHISFLFSLPWLIPRPCPYVTKCIWTTKSLLQTAETVIYVKYSSPIIAFRPDIFGVLKPKASEPCPLHPNVALFD